MTAESTESTESPTSTTTTTMGELPGLVGSELGRSDWLEVTQEKVNTFADATDDHQWIHVDPERAKNGPFGGPIAHGYLTLSLVVPLFTSVLEVTDRTMAVNYGINKARFPSPVPVGSRLRLVATLAAAEPVGDKALQLLVDCVIELDGAAKPACVAQLAMRFFG
ncbi:MaoC family dehydratase [uncultured Jatrophihabitans sp.]|uniref:MaoC family dehydratase n=1 Tax=uncultured Jatrophihabitans sp. TaxID=1610747 RepID=UPI0035CA5C0E